CRPMASSGRRRAGRRRRCGSGRGRRSDGARGWSRRPARHAGTRRARRAGCRSARSRAGAARPPADEWVETGRSQDKTRGVTSCPRALMAHQLAVGEPRMPHYIAALRRCIPALMAAALVALGMARSLAADDPDPDEGRRGIVSAVVDGDTLSLTDGRTLRLAGIMAPKHQPVDEPLADAARGRLAALA